MDIGRKIYYELLTGNVIMETGERSGYVIETTMEQDFQSYLSLRPYNMDLVGVIQLPFGLDAINFGKYPYHIDITQNPPVIVWDTTASTGASLADAQNAKIAQLADMYKQTLSSGFNATVSGVAYTFGWSTDDKANLDAAQTAIDRGFASFPIYYADVHGNTVTLNTQTDLNTIEQTATVFNFAQHQQILSLIGQVKTATTVDAVNTIQWSPAGY